MEPSFKTLVFDYLNTLVPYWRVSDDAIMLSDGLHLIGIGVLRNDAFPLLVLTMDEPGYEQPSINQHVPRRGDFVVVLDDRNGPVPKMIESEYQIPTILWSNRESLIEYVIKDVPYDADRKFRPGGVVKSARFNM